MCTTYPFAIIPWLLFDEPTYLHLWVSHYVHSREQGNAINAVYTGIDLSQFIGDVLG